MLIDEIKASIVEGNFIPYFQPKTCFKTGEVLGAECLMRWDHPEKGILSPFAFIECAERENLLNDIDDLILVKSLEFLKILESHNLHVPHLSINITSSRLTQKNFAEYLLKEVEKNEVKPEQVGLEILETVLLDDSQNDFSSVVKKLHQKGFHIHLDDFGTGYTSIASLRVIPVETVKIDRSLIAGIDQDSELQKMTGAIIEMLRELQIQSLAEGVETVEEFGQLAKMNCNQIQGYYIARPLPANEFMEWIADKKIKDLDTKNPYTHDEKPQLDVQRKRSGE